MTITPDEIEKAFADSGDGDVGDTTPAAETEAQPEPDPQPQPEPEPAADPDPVRSFGGQLLAGKYRTPEELADAYRQLEQKLGEQGAELGQYRTLIEQARQQAQTPPPQTDDDLARFDAWAEEQPIQAAQYALQTSPQLYERVMTNWYDLDPKGASRFERALEMHAMQQQMQAAYGQPLQHVREQRQQEEILEAWAEVQARHTDINAYATQIQQAFETYPHLLAPLQTGTREDRARAIEAAYLVARALPQPDPQPQAQGPGQGPVLPGAGDKLAATVTTGHTPPGPGQTRQTEAERIWQMFDENSEGYL